MLTVGSDADSQLQVCRQWQHMVETPVSQSQEQNHSVEEEYLPETENLTPIASPKILRDQNKSLPWWAVLHACLDRDNP